MTQITVTQYAELKGISRQAVLQQINWACKKGNKLKDGSLFEKPFRDYIIEITGAVEKLYKSLKVDSELSQE